MKSDNNILPLNTGKNKKKRGAPVAIINARADDLEAISTGLADSPFEIFCFNSPDDFPTDPGPDPFGLIIFDGECRDLFLGRAAKNYPEAILMMVARDLDYEESIEAVQSGRLFDFLSWPCPEKILKNAVRTALDFGYLISLNLPVFTSPWNPYETKGRPDGQVLPGSQVFNHITRQAREAAGWTAWLEDLAERFDRHFSEPEKCARDAATELKKIKTVVRHLAAASRRQIQDLVRDLEHIGLSSGLWALSGDGTSKEVVRQCFGLALEKMEAQSMLVHQTDELQTTTSALKKTKTDLVEKGFIAGQVQMASSVLHNIGNAVTPVLQIIEEINHDEFPLAVEYFRKSVDELYEHRENLSWFVNEDKRGCQIFSFLSELAGTFSKIEQSRKNLRIQTAEAMTYISQIISLSQSYRSSGKSIREKTSLNIVVEQAVLMQDREFRKRNIEIRKNLAPENPFILIDKNKLWQVLVNLMKNACEAIDQADGRDKKHSITLETALDKGVVSFSITDSGIGAEPADVSGLFEYGKSKKGSSGLGLFFCKQFVEENSGILSLESKGLGKGACVTIVFKPLNRP